MGHFALKTDATIGVVETQQSVEDIIGHRTIEMDLTVAIALEVEIGHADLCLEAELRQLLRYQGAPLHLGGKASQVGIAQKATQLKALRLHHARHLAASEGGIQPHEACIGEETALRLHTAMKLGKRSRPIDMAQARDFRRQLRVPLRQLGKERGELRKVSTEADNIHLPVVGRIFQRHAAREAGVEQALALQTQTAHLQLGGSHTSLKLQAHETVAILQPGLEKG